VRYWWVNQNQTFRQEQTGGYLWSPKRNANGAKNPFYETMREVSPGDVIFSFSNTFIAAIGVAQSYCWESPKPAEFGSTGQYWENVGWKVRVQFTSLNHRIRPKDHIEVLRPLLPDKYAPLQPNGNGIKSVYLTELPPPLAEMLAGIIGTEAQALIGSIAVDLHTGPDGQQVLTIKDDGVGLPPGLNVMHAPSLGWRLVRTLSRQIGAGLTVRDVGPGTEAVVEFYAKAS